MRRMASVLALLVLVFLFDAPQAWGGGGLAEEILTGQITGPAVLATVEIDPTDGSPSKARTAVRLQKGTAYAGAVFLHEEAANWKFGCDGTKGARLGSERADLNVDSLTRLRFDDKPLRNWMPDAVINALLFAPVSDGGLGLDPATLPNPIAGITEIDNPVCTKVEGDEGVTKYILSFSALIQFAQGAAVP